MSADWETLEHQRDQALADLADLERQVADNEIPDDVAVQLRRRYEASVASAIEALDEVPEPQAQDTGRTPRRFRARGAAYVVAAVIAVIAAVVVLPQYVASRPEGGFVTGNEAAQLPTAAPSVSPVPAPRDLSTVTDAEMEAVVTDNPSVLGMRLALAGRYLDQGKYDKAAEHYGVALKQDPGNPEVLAGAGWVLFQLGQVDAALRFIDQALTIDPRSPDAQWYKANILLDARKDPATALALLRQLAQRDDLLDDRQAQVRQLITRAEQADGQ
ncbi:Cytochrome c-type biogenesis protein CcmH/NrfG [Amycolatopsis marina]|uniref:Cytochrome c-type biogenesis protein CcmH/NrfG n=1 Tax=Amycolatopsis marina TaxID=490629 RepID=A0A1I1CQH3_9PSEU|nr:tetratricopeptide repeat protein [Amycolatopsis marina]SFB62693.1 Cytochrome c-type biogenesis protein CcmH/NrfG [Amycolatopsis marina]